MNDLTPARRKQEPFSMIPKRVLAAKPDLLGPSAKIVFGVLNGQPNAQRGQPVHLTQDQISMLSGLAPRTVQTAVKQLVAVHLVDVLPLPALNGWKVNSYRVRLAEESLLPPTPALQKAYSPHMREVLRAHRRDPAAPQTPEQDAETAHQEAPESTAYGAHAAATRHADVADKGEHLQEGPVQKKHREEIQIAEPLPPPIFSTDGFDGCDAWLDLPDFTAIQDALEELGGALLDAMESQAWDVTECNALITASWDDSVPPSANLRRVLRRARAFA